MSELMTVGNDSWLEDHWYLQPWMTDFRPSARTGAVPLESAPHRSGRAPVSRRQALPSVIPQAFDSMRGRMIPRTPLLGGGLSVISPPTVPALRTERRLVAGLLLAALLIYVAINAGFPSQLLRSIGLNPHHPLLWPVAQAFYWSSLTLAALAVWQSGLASTPRATSPLLSAAALGALFQISLVVVAGILLGFGRSPYARGLSQISANLLYVLAVLAAIELCRACVVVVVARTNPTVAVAIGTLLFALVRIPLAKLVSIEGGDSAFSFFGGELLPALAIGLVASVLALAGGPLPAMVYVGTLQAFEWLAPILPNLEWAELAFVGTLGPVVVLAILQPTPEPVVAVESQAPTRHRWAMATALSAVAAIWFISGFFGVQPIAVSGPSMTPTFELGDLVIVQRVEPADIVVGDVVQFQKGSTDVIHRVVEIRTERGALVFVTQGDGNNVADDPISSSRIRGRVVTVIPKLGWPSIALRSILS